LHVRNWIHEHRKNQKIHTVFPLKQAHPLKGEKLFSATQNWETLFATKYTLSATHDKDL
jgi:hypothetical protein